MDFGSFVHFQVYPLCFCSTLLTHSRTDRLQRGELPSSTLSQVRMTLGVFNNLLHEF